MMTSLPSSSKNRWPVTRSRLLGTNADEYEDQGKKFMLVNRNMGKVHRLGFMEIGVHNASDTITTALAANL